METEPTLDCTRGLGNERHFLKKDKFLPSSFKSRERKYKFRVLKPIKKTRARIGGISKRELGRELKGKEKLFV